MKINTLVSVVVVGLVLGATGAFAQQNTGAREGRRQFDPEQMRAQMSERMKEQLKISDDEWQVIQPLLENVMMKQRAGGMRGFMRMGNRGPGGARFGGEQPAEVVALQTALESDTTSAAELKSAMAALRKSREASQVELKKARDELRAVLSQRQEAQLVLSGLLD